MHLLYIDPGTGSALFSILIGATATFYFLMRKFIIIIKFKLSNNKKISFSDKTYDYVIYNEGKQYSDVFKPILNEFEKRNINVLFLSSSKDDPLFNNNYIYIKHEYIGDGNKAFARLNLLKADIVLMTTPGLDVYQLKRSKGVRHYSHILHSPGDATMYRLFGLDYFDSVLLTGDYQKNDIRLLEEKREIHNKILLTVGCTYLDVYSEKIKQIPKAEKDKITVIVSPSWGKSGLLTKYGEKLIDPLLNTDMHIIIRPHPQSKISENNILTYLENKYLDFSNIEWDFNPENIYSLNKSDIMISDFSGIVFDYSFLFNKPFLYIKQGIDLRPYDADDLGDNAIEKLWQFKVLEIIGTELIEENFKDLNSIIKKSLNNSILKSALEEVKNTAWQYAGEAGRNVVDFLISQRCISKNKV